MIPAGDLQERVAIQAQTAGVNAIGEPAPTWATVARTWASIEQLTGDALVVAKSVHPSTSHRFRMRSHPELTHSARLVADGVVYRIASFTEDGSEVELTAYAEG